jgi:predicted transcriptional regulator of viral defense system
MHMPFTQFAQSAPLFTLEEVRELYKKDRGNRSLLNLLQRLKKQRRVRQIANGVYSGAFAATPLNRYRVPSALRTDAVVALHSALEFHGLANQTFQTIYYFSARLRKDVIFDGLTYHAVVPPRPVLLQSQHLFQAEQGAEQVLVTGRERSFVDCLLFLDYSGGLEELDKSLAMFPSFDFNAALAYLKLLRSPWLYSRLGFFLDRHADKLFFQGKARDRFLQKLSRGVAYLGDKRAGQSWIPTWKLMVPETFSPSRTGSVPT